MGKRQSCFPLQVWSAENGKSNKNSQKSRGLEHGSTPPPWPGRKRHHASAPLREALPDPDGKAATFSDGLLLASASRGWAQQPLSTDLTAGKKALLSPEKVLPGFRRRLKAGQLLDRFGLFDRSIRRPIRVPMRAFPSNPAYSHRPSRRRSRLSPKLRRSFRQPFQQLPLSPCQSLLRHRRSYPRRCL